MQQMYSCPNCQASVVYGQRFCGNCGIGLNWPAQQTPPPRSHGGHNANYQQQQQRNQRLPAQRPRDTQPPTNNQLQYRQNSKFIIFLGVLLFVLITIGGISFATNDAIFSIFTSPVVKSFAIDPPEISQGQTAIMKWNVSGATSVTIDNGIGTVPSSGTKTVSPTATTTYTLTATKGSRSKSGIATITLRNSPIITTFTADPVVIYQWQSSTLKWNVSGATSVTIDNGIGTVPSSGTKTVSPTATTIYTLTATNSIGSATRLATVTVNTSAPVVTSFTGDPATITPGQSSTLQWNISGATSVIIDNGIGTVSTSGTQTVSPTATTTYTLTATNSIGSKTVLATVTVIKGLPMITSFTADTATITSDNFTTLRWNIIGAKSVSIDQNIGRVFLNAIEVSPKKTTTYILTATNSVGSATASVTVTVAHTGAPVINSFIKSQNVIAPGQSSTLQWDVTGATSVTIDNGIGTVSSTSGTQTVSPTATTTYTLTATNSAGSTTALTTVTLQ